jgi:SAM-dependent methyltransferase
MPSQTKAEMKPDYTEYLDPVRLEEEERLWGEVAIYRTYAGLVIRALELSEPAWLTEAAALRLAGRQPFPRLVVEVGCGTGWVPTELPDNVDNVDYVGLDKHPGCIRKAEEKNAHRRWSFIAGDFRQVATRQMQYEDGRPADVACSFAVLKHFGLHEWDAIVSKFLSWGRYATFTLPVWDPSPNQVESYDDGVDYPHVWIGRPHLFRVLEAAGHEVAETGPLAGTAEEWFITRQVV